MERVDVAVVGGGPAGSSAGEAAASGGADTVVIEKGVPRNDRKGLGPDSTDAAGFLDYWLDIADIDIADIPDDVILQELDGATFIGPTQQVDFHGKKTGLGGSYPHFGFTFHRARFDDWLRGRAEEAGAEYAIGTAVRAVEVNHPEAHHLELNDGRVIEAKHVILADGPARSVTIPTLHQCLPDDRDIAEQLGPRAANHIAYQEYRRFPPELFDRDIITFWWGWIPGHTAYPWVFPNSETVARVGLTMPIGLELEDVDNPGEYRLLRETDQHIPRGEVLIERLLDEAFPDREPSEFSIVQDRGKSAGTETYPISSTPPIDSPAAANIAVVGGAMGATSAFHEGGDHVAIRTGKIAGELAADDALSRYNPAWKRAIGAEVRRNLAMAATVKGFSPADWDRAFSVLNRLVNEHGSLNPSSVGYLTWLRAVGLTGLSVGARYRWHNRRLGGGDIVQIKETEYTVGQDA